MNDTSRALTVEYVNDGKWDDVNRMLAHIDSEIRQAAAAVMGGFASQKKLDIAPALETLTKRLSDEEDVANEAAFALTWHYINTGKWDEARSLLAHEVQCVRHVSAMAFGNAARDGNDIARAESGLAERFQEKSEGVVYAAVRALVLQAAVSGHGAPPKALLEHELPLVRKFAAEALNDLVFEPLSDNVPDLIEAALKGGVDINVKNGDGETPLVSAAKNKGRQKMVETLLAKGADPDSPDSGGRTALMHAAYQGRVEAVKLLLGAGADVNKVSEAEFTALDYACKGGELEIARMLGARGAKLGDKNNVLVLVCEAGYTEILKIVLEHGPDLNYRDGNGFTALMYAVLQGEEMVELLLDKGADPNVKNEDSTALSYAAQNERGAVVELLKKRGALG